MNLEPHVAGDSHGMADPSVSVYIGQGAASPGILAWEWPSKRLTRLLDMPAGHSIYAIHADKGQCVIAGTKGGLLCLPRTQHCAAPETGRDVATLFHGAPILAISAIDDIHVAVSDAHGGCYVWSTTGGTRPEPLPTGGLLICALLKLDDSTLLGLASDGGLLCWQLSTGQLLAKIPTPAPPAISALVSLTWWSSAGLVVFPGRSGELVQWRPPWRKPRLCAGHSQEWYALVLLEKDLVTIGLHDKQVIRWNSRTRRPQHLCETPFAVTSAALVGACPVQIVAITRGGGAYVCDFIESSFRPRERIAAADCRIVIGPGWEQLRTSQLGRERTEARQLSWAILAKSTSGQVQETEALHDRLEAIGYRHVSLGLRAVQARDRQDFVGELRAYAQMAVTLPLHAVPPESHARYVDLLERAWMYEEAAACRKHITRSANADYCIDASRRRSQQYANVLHNDQWIIHTVEPIELLVDAATAAGRAFHGKFVLRVLGDQLSCRDRVPLRAVAEKYERIRTSPGAETLPAGQHAHPWWLTDDRCERADVLLFYADALAGLDGLVFCLRLLDAHIQTAFTLAVLLDASHIASGDSVPEHNSRVRDCLRGLRGAPQANAWLQRVHGATRQAVQRVMTEAMRR